MIVWINGAFGSVALEEPDIEQKESPAMEKGQKMKKPEQPSLEQWAALYDVGINLKKLAPWRILRDQDILVIHLPGREEPVYCSVMGNGGQNYAIGVYPGKMAFWRLSRMIERTPDDPPVLFLADQDCLLCNFGDREELEPQDRAVLKELGLRFRGHNEWVYFRAMTPGTFPWFINAEQAELLLESLQNLFMLCKCYMEGNLKVDFNAGETLVRYYDAPKKTWYNTVIPQLLIPRPRFEMQLADELALARMKKQKKTGNALELEWLYLPIPIQENRKVQPYAVHLTLMLDRESGYILKQHMAGPDEEPLTAPPSMLVDYIMEYGRPGAVYVRTEEQASLLEHTCKTVGVKLIFGQKMTQTNECLESLMMSMMRGGLDTLDFDFPDELGENE